MSWKRRHDNKQPFQDLPRGIDAKTFNKLQQRDKGRSLAFHEKFPWDTSDHTGFTFQEIDAVLAAIAYVMKHNAAPDIASRKENITSLNKDWESAYKKLVNGLRTTYNPK